MKKWLLSLFVIVIFGVYAISQRMGTVQSGTIPPDTNTSTSQPAKTEPTVVTTTNEPSHTTAEPPAPKSTKNPTPVTTPASTTAPVTNSTPTPAPTVEPKKPTGMYKDGTYMGSDANAFFGRLQVSAVISNGKLSDVKFLQFPNDRGTSIQISNDSMPVLKSEAIQIQNAKVDIVSGATQTSEAFRESLAAALAKAKV